MADAVIALGDCAVRFARPGGSARAQLAAVRAWPGVVDVVIARDTIGVYFAGPPAILPGAIAALADLTDEVAPRDITLAATYDGPDLDDVARATGLAVAEVIARHTAATYRVELMGFSPGFAYLVGLDPALELPRRTTPRAKVPAGSLAIASHYTAVYPFASPGGWHLIGRVARPMFSSDGPALALGDRVRFAP